MAVILSLWIIIMALSSWLIGVSIFSGFYPAELIAIIPFAGYVIILIKLFIIGIAYLTETLKHDRTNTT